MLNKAIQRTFVYRVNSRSIIAPTRGYLPVLTRAELTKKIEHPDEDAIKLRKQLENKENEIVQHFANLKFNDNNPSNLIRDLKVNYVEDAKTVKPIPQRVVPDILLYSPKPILPTATGRFGRCKGSIKKISPTVKGCVGLHVNEAIHLMKNTQKRAAREAVKVLKNTRSNAILRGMDEMRLYVKDFIVNRSKRIKGVRYHAKMKRGLEEKDWCSLYVRLEEKRAEDFFRDFVGGKASLGVVSMWKTRIMSSPNALTLIRKFQFILTSKGRHQRREMIRRKAYTLQQQLAVIQFNLGKRLQNQYRAYEGESD